MTVDNGGAVMAKLEVLTTAIAKMEIKIDSISAQLPDHAARIKTNERNVAELWRFHNEQGSKMMKMVGFAITLATIVVSITTYIVSHVGC